MQLSSKLMYVLLGLTVLMLIGMLTGSWRVILYPFLLVVGVSILFGFTREIGNRSRPLLIAGPVVILFVVLFLVLDISTGMQPTGSASRVLGMTPPMAWYLLGFPPLAILVGVLYAVTFQNEEPETPQRVANEAAEGENGEVPR
ncbi:hypothetical protein BH20ACT11_BH20ACT11_08270 [soil metagenome]|jgi:hypothetical protein